MKLAARCQLHTLLSGAAFIAALALGAPALAAHDPDAATPAHRHHHCLHGTSCHRHPHVVYMRPAPSSFIIDATSGKILEQDNPDSLRYPASLTKMMTLYLTFDALKKGQMHLDQTIPVSQHASEQPQTNIALQPGQRIAVKDAILSIVVRSANDSAVTLGEALGGGSEPEFAKKMTAKAHALGMNNTVFYNASGLPNPAQHTTARDMATLGRALRHDFPQYFPFFKTESFSYRDKIYVTHNHVMTRYDGVDGIKTGFIRASGFNLVTSVKRDGHNLIAVVMGGSTARSRDDKMIALLDHTFTQLAANDNKQGVKLASAQRKPATLQAKAYGQDDAAEGEGDQQEDDTKAVAAANAPQAAAQPQQALQARPKAAPHASPAAAQ